MGRKIGVMASFLFFSGTPAQSWLFGSMVITGSLIAHAFARPYENAMVRSRHHLCNLCAADPRRVLVRLKIYRCREIQIDLCEFFGFLHQQDKSLHPKSKALVYGLNDTLFCYEKWWGVGLYLVSVGSLRCWDVAVLVCRVELFWLR